MNLENFLKLHLKDNGWHSFKKGLTTCKYFLVDGMAFEYIILETSTAHILAKGRIKNDYSKMNYAQLYHNMFDMNEKQFYFYNKLLRLHKKIDVIAKRRIDQIQKLNQRAMSFKIKMMKWDNK